MTADGSHDILTLRENGMDLETRRVPVQWSNSGEAQAPSLAAYAMVRDHPSFGSNYTVSWQGRGFSVVLK